MNGGCRPEKGAVQPAGHRVGRVVDIAYVVAHGLAQKVAGGHQVQPEILGQPARHLGCRVLQRLVQRTGIAEGEDIALGLAAGPGDATLLDRQAEGDLETGLDPGADDLAVALKGMGIPQEEQRTGGRDRKPDRGTWAEAPVVHVAAMLARGGGGDRLAHRGRHAEAADHRRHGQGQPLS